MRRRAGFTLIELLIVILIIVILAGVTVMLMNVFFKGQGVRQAGMIVTQAVAQGKQTAAETREVVFLVFSRLNQDGFLELHKDTNGDGVYQGDQDPRSNDADEMLEGQRIDLPRLVVFENAPAWLSFQPSGYIGLYGPGGGAFPEVQASEFDRIMNGTTPNAIGDVILLAQGQGFRMCMDLDRASGKVRRHFFLSDDR